MLEIKWYKMDENAIVPSKDKENAGYDVYALKSTTIMPGETQLVGTGLGVVVPEGYYLEVWDRGSNGSIGLHRHCGVVDNGYRGEIFIALCNTTNKPIVITSQVEKTKETDDTIYYPITKGISQLILKKQEDADCVELTAEEWELLKHTKRGDGKLGSSGK